MFLYSIFLLFPLWVRQYSVCKIHTLFHVSVFFLAMFFVLCSHELFVFFTLFQFHIFFYSCLDQSSSGSFPQRYIACVWLHASDAFWLSEPPAPHCFSVCTEADTPLSTPSFSTCILTSSSSFTQEVSQKKKTFKKGALCSAQCGGSQPDVLMQFLKFEHPTHLVSGGIE